MATTFTYEDYKESDAVKKRAQELASHESNKVQDWTGGTYGQQLKDQLSAIQNRKKFTYDLNGDALYNQYKDQYIRQGKLAIQDTMGQAAALTGGYGSSYGVTAGNQAYQGYLQGLNDKIPELYQLAADQYAREGDQMQNMYGLLSDAYGKEYGEYQDKLAQWNTTRDYLANMYQNERNFDYGKYGDDRNMAFQSYESEVAQNQWEQELAYKKAQDAIANQQWQQEFALKQAAAKSSSTGSKTTKSKTTENSLDNIAGTATKNTETFKASILTSREFARRKNNTEYDSYKDYVDDTIDKWFNGNGPVKLTANEAKWLMDYYGLE